MAAPHAGTKRHFEVSNQWGVHEDVMCAVSDITLCVWHTHGLWLPYPRLLFVSTNALQ